MTDRSALLDPASPLPLWVGLGMALAAMLAAIVVLATFGLATFPSITQACAINGLTEIACTSMAWKVGEFAILAFGIVLALGITLHRRLRRAAAPLELPDAGVRVVLAIALAVVLYHVLMQVAGPAFASRSDESLRYGTLISIENLLWPLLLQLYLSQREQRLRTAVLATLLALMALSPYRSAMLAIMIFGFAVPLATTLWRTMRAGWPRALVLGAVRQGMLAIGIGIVVVWGGYVGTVNRFPSMLVVDQFLEAHARAQKRPPVKLEPETKAEPVQARSAPQAAPAPFAKPAAQPGRSADLPVAAVTVPPPVALVPRLAQRVVFPLYQAAIVGDLATRIELPSLWNELGRKFRLSHEPTLEEFLFRRIYGGEGPDQTTSLYFGEAVAYFPGPPLLWMIFGPLALVAAALMLQRRGIPAATTLGVALWRSSFSGVAPILPALVLQLAALGALGQANRRTIPAFLRQASHHALTALLAVVLGAQLWAIAVTPTRRALVIADFNVVPRCTLVSPSWVPIYTDRVMVAAGLSIRSSLAWSVSDAMAVSLPFGARSERMVGDVARYLGGLVGCETEVPVGERVSTAGMHRFPAPINPLDVLSAVALAVALVGAVRRSAPP